MVKTRHGLEEEASPGGEFLSLRTRSAKRYSRSDMEDTFLLSGDDNTPRTKRQRVVSMRARVSSPEEPQTPSRRSLNRSTNNRVQSPVLAAASPMRTRGKSRTPTAPAPRDLSPSSAKTPEDSRSPRRSCSREFKSLTKDGPVNVVLDEDDDEGGIRRSRRARKQIYGTMNQNLLTEMMLAGGTNPSPDEVLMTKKRQSRRPAKPETDEEEQEDEDEDEEEEDEEGDKASESGMDMYSRIKNRQLAKKKKQKEIEELANKECEEEEEEEEEDDSDEDSDEDDSDEDEESEEEDQQPQYSLRQHRTTTKRYTAPQSEPQKRKSTYAEFMNPNSPLRRRHFKHKKHLTPRRSYHNLSSTSSDDSDDERRFERRKNKSMAKARNRCLPMNLTKDDLAGGLIKDRQRIGSSLADVDPMNVDQSVSFDQVGGLGSHVQALKEMVVFPLLYPEVFERFKISPPRGVLFHGPPGTGKTLVARALANECRQGDKRVAFFMRKGADCLSKWVGESERQLRLLFDQAYSMRPSIIFFDEIDGLAPVRSSRQDQIHSSIVSTLLALMDGLDSRGEVVVIGATNRIDAIDPALRRPGRFDREFLFPLPSLEARTSILTIHTSKWNPKLSNMFVAEVAEKCVGYCGADLKALCTEAALFALRRRYPQIYTSKEKLQLDVTEIQVSARDFHQAMKRIVPASQRSVVSPGRGLTVLVRPLLENQFRAALDVLQRVFPAALYQTSTTKVSEVSSNALPDALQEEEFSDDEGGASIFDNPSPRVGAKRGRTPSSNGASRSFLNFTSTSYHQPHAHRPRFLITGKPGMGQSSHLAPAILHHMERLPVHCLDLPALYACSAKTPEESCAQVFREARRTIPSIVYIPHINHWWDACSLTLQATFLMLLRDLPPSAPILLLATSDQPLSEMPQEVQTLFGCGQGEMLAMRLPRMEERREFFRDLILNQAARAPVVKRKAVINALEVLPVAPPKEPASLTQTELEKLAEVEERKLRELRIFLRDVLTRLASERKFRVFTSPVDPEEVPDYAEVIKNPMDLFTMNNKINLHQYTSAKQFLSDIDLITSNALEYNPDKNPNDRMIRNRACELKDMAYAIIDAEMDSEFETQCEEIEESRTRRKENPAMAKTAPSFYKTFHQLTLAQAQQQAQELANQKQQGKEQDRATSSLRPKKTKKYVSRRRSAWSRGFISNKPKKKPVARDDADEDEENDKDNEEEEEEEEEEEQGERVEEGEENGEKLTNGPLMNGDMFHQDTSNDSVATSTAPSTLSQITTDDGPAHRLRGHGSPTVNHAHINGRDSDEDSIVSGPRTRTRHGSAAHSDHGGKRSPRLSKINKDTTDTPLQNGIDSEESSVEVEPPTLQMVEPLVRPQDHHQDNDMDVDEVVDEDNGVENSGSGRNKHDTPTSGDSNKGKSGDGIASLRRSSRRLTQRIQADPVATVDKVANIARQILDEPAPVLAVDHDRLKRLLENVTLATVNFTIEKLERLYSVLSQCVYRHRLSYDKTQLTQEMEEVVAKIRVPSCWSTESQL